MKLTIVKFLGVLVAGVAIAALAIAGADDKKGTNDKTTYAGMTKSEIREKLTPEQYRVVVENGTEPPFRNEYWDNHRAGIYVDVITDKPLFSSTDKFDSGTGWPSFTRTIEKDVVTEKTDRSYGMVRIEVVSSSSNAHLGHLFPDGPQPTGDRYCVNSASLRFIPVEELEEKGYGKYLKLFRDDSD